MHDNRAALGYLPKPVFNVTLHIFPQFNSLLKCTALTRFLICSYLSVLSGTSILIQKALNPMVSLYICFTKSWIRPYLYRKQKKRLLNFLQHLQYKSISRCSTKIPQGARYDLQFLIICSKRALHLSFYTYIYIYIRVIS